MSPTTVARWRAAILVIAPVVMLAGFLYHPHIGNPTDAEFVPRLAEAVAAEPARWAVAHFAVAVGSALLILAFLAVRVELRERGQDGWSGPALPFIVVGSVLYALLPAMEFGPLAAFHAGADVEAVQTALYTWFIPTLFTAGLIFLVGAVGFAVDIGRSGISKPAVAWVVAAALVVMSVSRLVPLSVVQFHVQGMAGLVAFWPLAHHVGRRRREGTREGMRQGTLEGTNVAP